MIGCALAFESWWDRISPNSCRERHSRSKMDRFAVMQMFVRVVEGGSFSSAARSLRIGQSTISKQIAALESQLGAELMRRTSRTLKLTESGRDFYDAAVRLLEDYE